MRILTACCIFLVSILPLSADPITSDQDLYIWLHHYFEGRSKQFIVDSLEYLGERENVDASLKLSLVPFFSKCLNDDETRKIIDSKLPTLKSQLIHDVISQAKTFNIDKLLASSDYSLTLNYQCLAAYSATGDSKYLEYLLQEFLNHSGEDKNEVLFLSAVRAGEILNTEWQVLDSVRIFLEDRKRASDSPLLDELLSTNRFVFSSKYLSFLRLQAKKGIWKETPGI